MPLVVRKGLTLTAPATPGVSPGTPPEKATGEGPTDVRRPGKIQRLAILGVGVLLGGVVGWYSHQPTTRPLGTAAVDEFCRITTSQREEAKQYEAFVALYNKLTPEEANAVKHLLYGASSRLPKQKTP